MATLSKNPEPVEGVRGKRRGQSKGVRSNSHYVYSMALAHPSTFPQNTFNYLDLPIVGLTMTSILYV